MVNPATTATAERSFSLARRIKTWMRSTSTAARFNSLAILHGDKSETDSIDLINIANEFTSKNKKPPEHVFSWINTLKEWGGVGSKLSNLQNLSLLKTWRPSCI